MKTFYKNTYSISNKLLPVMFNNNKKSALRLLLQMSFQAFFFKNLAVKKKAFLFSQYRKI